MCRVQRQGKTHKSLFRRRCFCALIALPKGVCDAYAVAAMTARLSKRLLLSAGLLMTALQAGANSSGSIPLPALERHLPPASPLDLETILVTGSRIPQGELEGSQPVVRLERSEIALTGAQSLSELLGQLVYTGAAPNRSATSSEEGGQSVNLRGIGAERTLVLLNGRRLGGGLYYYGTGTSDLSLIPLSAVESIEILTDGASAIYGSDAISGVVNILTRKSLRGWEGRTQLGSYQQRDGRSVDLGLSYGGRLGRTDAFLDVSYSEAQPVFRRDRSLTKDPVLGAGPSRGDLATPRGTLMFIPTPQNATLLGPDLCPGLPEAPLCFMLLRPGETIRGGTAENTATVASLYEPFNESSLDPEVNDLFNPHTVLALAHPEKRLSAFGTLDRSMGPLDAQLEWLYTRRTLSQPQPVPAFFGDFIGDRFADVYVAADNLYNPFDQDIGRADPDTGIGAGAILRILSEVPNPAFETQVDGYRLGARLNGALDALPGFMDWELGWVYAASRSDAQARVLLNLEHLALALGPAARCADTPGCVPLNIFGGPGSITPDMLEYVSFVAGYPKQQSLSLGYAGLRGDLLQLQAGPVQAAAGVEYRRESYADQPDSLIESCASSFCFPATSGAFTVSEAYAELRVPLLADRTLAESLNLDVALRQSDYKAFGSSTNTKIGLAWKPQPELLLRLSRSSAFRAPSISDAYLSSASYLLGLADPCSDYAGSQGGEPASATVQTNCRNAGVPESYVQQTPVLTRDGGNPELKPETASTLNAGIVYSPAALDGFTLSADWYRIALDEVILILGPQLALDSCYGTRGGAQTCDLITRDDASGGIVEFRNVPINLGEGTAEGLDLRLRYQSVPLAWGRIGLDLQAAYAHAVTAELINTDGSAQVIDLEGTNGVAGAFPRWRANAALVWEKGNFGLSWTSRYIHAQSEPCDDGLTPSLTALGLCSDPDASDPAHSKNELEGVLYHDLQGRYGHKVASLALGVQNLFDQSPPASYSNPNNSYDASSYPMPGRFFYLRLESRF